MPGFFFKIPSVVFGGLSDKSQKTTPVGWAMRLVRQTPTGSVRNAEA
jgi:hypothetical protein